MKMFGNHWNIRYYQVIPIEKVSHEESAHMIKRCILTDVCRLATPVSVYL